MINNLMSVSELASASGATSTANRARYKVPIITTLSRAHEISVGHPEYAQRLRDLLEECEEWLSRHRGKKFRRRREAVTRLRDQVAALLAPLATARRAADDRLRSSRETGKRTAALSEIARAEQSGLARAPGEADDPRIAKGRAGFQQELLEATIRQARKLNHVDDDLNVEQVGYLAAKVALKVDAVLDPQSRQRCTAEAMRVLCAMLGKNRELATAFSATGVEVVVVPADRPMTDLVEFSSLKGVNIVQGSAPNSRTWDSTRGVGGLVVGSTVYVAITEENLLGGVTTGAALPAGACYATRYSTTAHEFAHALHQRALTATQKATITAAYQAATQQIRIEQHHGAHYLRIPASMVMTGPALTNRLNQIFSRQFADGPRRKPGPSQRVYRVIRDTTADWLKMPGSATDYLYTPNAELQNCYAAFDEREYFAQAVNCYLGANGGSDPYTGQPRNNGEAWLRAHEEPQLVQLLDTLFAAGPSAYAKAQLPDTNVAEPSTLVTTIQDYIAQRRAIKELSAIEI